MKKLATFFALLALMLSGMVATSTGAQAKAAATGWECMGTGVTNLFGSYGGTVTFDPFNPHQNTFPERECVLKGMNLIRWDASTKDEYIILRELARERGKDGLRMPPVLCKTRTDATRGYLIDLEYFYSPMLDFTRAEKRQYPSWAKRYVRKHPECRLFY